MSPAEQFRDAIRAAGLVPPDIIEPGRFYRFPGDGKRDGNKAAWCKLFDDGLGGVFGDFSSGLDQHWQAARERPMTQAERDAWRRQVDESRRQAEAERAAEAERKAVLAQRFFKGAEPLRQHAYPIKKGILGSAGAVRVEFAERLKDDDGRPLTGLHGICILIPARRDGRIVALQVIDAEGNKRFVGAIGGAAFVFGVADGADRLVVCEGWATGASIHEATGLPVVCAFTAGALAEVAKRIRASLPNAQIVIAADDDINTAGNPGITKATEAAQAVGGKLAIPDFGSDRPDGATDFNDLRQQCGVEAVERAIAGASEPAMGRHHPDADGGPVGGLARKTATPVALSGATMEAIKRLASMSLLEYDQNRRDAAKSLGVRPATLDKVVLAERKEDDSEGIGFPDIEPWTSPVDPGALLSEISATLRRFIVCQHETADAAALWVAMTWFMDVVQVAPMAIITAPEKRCGKSQLLFLLGKLSYRPLTASNISPAALFRAVDAWNPTLLVDEADAFMRDNEELRGVLNSGHTRDSAYVIRVVGEDFTPQRFSVWGAKALAGIGHLADTLMDRAVVIELRRKLPHESVERLRHADPGLFDELAQKLSRLAEDYRDAVRRARPDLPGSLNDRAQDNWEPLLAIADIAGGEWATRGRKAALKLSGTESLTMSTGTELLADIQEIFETKKVDKISTAQLIEALCEDDERPWATYNRGKPITPRQVSKRLGEYGISSTTIRVNYDTPKGFRREMFDEAFSRYLVSTTIPIVGEGTYVAECCGVADCCGNKTVSATPKAAPDKECCGVADTKSGSGNACDVVEDIRRRRRTAAITWR